MAVKDKDHLLLGSLSSNNPKQSCLRGRGVVFFWGAVCKLASFKKNRIPKRMHGSTNSSHEITQAKAHREGSH